MVTYYVILSRDKTKVLHYNNVDWLDIKWLFEDNTICYSDYIYRYAQQDARACNGIVQPVISIRWDMYDTYREHYYPNL